MTKKTFVFITNKYLLLERLVARVVNYCFSFAKLSLPILKTIKNPLM